MADIKGKPDRDVYGVGAPTRATDGSRKFTLSWQIGDWAKNSSNERRIQGFDIEFDINCYHLKTGEKKKLTYQRSTSNLSHSSWTIDLNNFKLKEGDAKTYGRDTDFYPVNGWWCIRSITGRVRTYNSKGKGAWVGATREIQQPRKPSISISQDPQSGDVTWTVTHNKGLDYRENWSTRVTYEVFDSSRAEGSKVIASGDSSFGTSSDSKTGSYDIYNRMGKRYDDYARITVKAWSRGMWGASDTVTKELYVGWPMEPEITDYRCETMEPTGLVTVFIDNHYKTRGTDEGKTNPVTGVRLCTLVSSDYENATDIPGDVFGDPSTETNIVDDGQCSALSTTVANLRPSAGKYTWVWVKAWNQSEEIFYRYSKPLRIRKLETKPPTAQDDEITIANVRSGDDGKSIVLTLGWNDDDSTGTEVSWSTNGNAWRSTETPSASQFEWDDGPGVIDGVSYDKTAELHVMGLTEGTLYHFRARRYLETEDGTDYGEYCPSGSTVTGIPSTSPSNATIMVDQYVPEGTALGVTWTYDSEATQRYWEVITGTTTTTTVDGVSYSRITGNEKVLANGTDATGSCQIPWSVWGGKVTSNQIALAVRVSTGGDPVTSDAKIVTIASKPVVTLYPDDYLEEQPYSIDIHCTRLSEVTLVCLSQYAEQVLPDGRLTQVTGDGILSMVVTPEWDAVSGGYFATVDLPEGLPFIDLCEYTLEVSARDLSTNMVSDVETVTIPVSYAHKAPEPSDEIAVTVNDVTDEGVRTRYATIELAEPEEANDGDVYDVYRVTQDGASICARGVSLDGTLVDEYAPFGTGLTAYRVACRTPDGSVDWHDYEYEFGAQDVFSREIRIDFGDDYVETSRGVSVSDSWKKDVEIRPHLDGSRPAYWNESVARSGSITGASIRVYEPDVDAAFRRLAKYSGVAFVRTNDGLAFRANVNVSIGTPKYTAAENVSLSFDEVTSESYMATEV